MTKAKTGNVTQAKPSIGLHKTTRQVIMYYYTSNTAGKVQELGKIRQDILLFFKLLFPVYW